MKEITIQIMDEEMELLKKEAEYINRAQELLAKNASTREHSFQPYTWTAETVMKMYMWKGIADFKERTVCKREEDI